MLVPAEKHHIAKEQRRIALENNNVLRLSGHALPVGQWWLGVGCAEIASRGRCEPPFVLHISDTSAKVSRVFDDDFFVEDVLRGDRLDRTTVTLIALELDDEERDGTQLGLIRMGVLNQSHVPFGK